MFSLRRYAGFPSPCQRLLAAVVGTTGSPRAHRAGRRGGGFTLLELMIVLSVLALLVGIAWPTLRRPLMRSTTQEAARQLVRDVARARMASVESGLTIALRFEPGGSRYAVAPAEVAGPPGETAGTPAMAATNAPDGTTRPESDWSFFGEFEYDVVFRDPEAAENPLLQLDSTLGQSLRNELEETEAVRPLIDNADEQGELSAPILFYPTGRAENADFVLDGPDGYSVTVTLRGLTGAVKIGALERLSEGVARDGQSDDQPAPRDDRRAGRRDSYPTQDVRQPDFAP